MEMSVVAFHFSAPFLLISRRLIMGMTLIYHACNSSLPKDALDKFRRKSTVLYTPIQTVFRDKNEPRLARA